MTHYSPRGLKWRAPLLILLIEAEDYFEFTRQCSMAVEKTFDAVEAMIHRHLETVPTSGFD